LIRPSARYLIIRLSSLGDIVHTLPAFSALRRRFPEADISWLVEEPGKEILELVPGIDRIIPVSVKKAPVASGAFCRELAALRKTIRERNQVAFDFQGLIKSSVLAWLSGAEKRIGFSRKNLREPLASAFYTHRLGEVSERWHVIDKNLALLSLLGMRATEHAFPLRIPAEITASVDRKLRDGGYDGTGKLVVFNVGAAWPTKRWPPDRWSRVIRETRGPGVFPLILWGNSEERVLARQVEERTGAPLSPPLSIKEVFALVSRASLLVSGDTFALQAACALGRPVVGLFGPTDPGRNGPFSARDKVAFHELECSRCYKRSCGRLECMEKITAEEVARLCREALDESA